MTGWSDGFVAVDWGTTNRRAYAIDAAGAVVDEFEDDTGVLSVPTGGFDPALGVLRDRFGAQPMLLAGMVGSNRGWIEAPYVPCPATLADVAAHLCWAEPGRTAIVPGLSFVGGDDADVMRGEEVQILGVQALGLVAEEATICHPGTHAKWIEARAGGIARFRTIMTGELFSLLRQHSILAPMLKEPATPGDAFLAGVDRALAGEALAADLFSVRARILLGIGQAADAGSYASGILIGSDVRSGLATARAGEEIAVVGRPSLTSLYAAAIRRAGHGAREIDGAAAFVAGMRAIAEKIG